MYKLIFFIILFFVSISNAQSFLGLRGIKIGTNFSAFREDHKDVIQGPTLGLFAENRLVEYASINFEAFYTIKGGIIKNEPMSIYGVGSVNEGIYFYDVEVSIAYFEFPFLLKFYIPIKKNVEFQFFSGPSFSIPLSDHTKITKKNQSQAQSHNFNYHIRSTPLPEIEKNVKFGYQIGFGLKISYFYLDFRYNQLSKRIGSLPQILNIYNRSHAVDILIGIDISEFSKRIK